MGNVLLNLDEQNEIDFKISLRGSTSNIQGKPTIRFLISEKSGSMAVALPVQNGDNGVVKVIVPPLKTVFNETSEYIGKLEVIVGDKYFAPTSMDIKFEKAVEVSANPVSVSKHNQKHNLLEQLEDEPSPADELIMTEKNENGKRTLSDEYDIISELADSFEKPELPKTVSVSKPAKKLPASKISEDMKKKFKRMLMGR